MSSVHSERGRRMFQAEVTVDAEDGVKAEHPKGKLLGMAKEYGSWEEMAEESGKVNQFTL